MHSYKEQTELTILTKAIDIVREYNHLVESNFKIKHHGWLRRNAEKSPKTLSNLFKK
jgi:hypothetical protein